MTILRPSSPIFAATAMVALLLSLASQAHAQTTPFIDSTTQMRSIRNQPTTFDPTSGAPQASNGVSGSFQGNPGCNSSVLNNSLQNSANFSYTQQVAVSVNTLQEPTSYSSCIQGLITKIQDATNLFSSGFSVDALFAVGFNQAIEGMISNLENQACAAIGSVLPAANGSLGTINLNYNIAGGGIAIQANMSGSAGGGSVTP